MKTAQLKSSKVKDLKNWEGRTGRVPSPAVATPAPTGRRQDPQENQSRHLAFFSCWPVILPMIVNVIEQVPYPGV